MAPTRYPYTMSVAVTSAPTSVGFSAHAGMSFMVPATTTTDDQPYLSLTRFKGSVAFSVSLVIVEPFEVPTSSADNGFSVQYFYEVYSTYFDMIPANTIAEFSFIVASLVAMRWSRVGHGSQLIGVPADLHSFSLFAVKAPRVQCLPVGYSTTGA